MPPNQQLQSTEGKYGLYNDLLFVVCACWLEWICWTMMQWCIVDYFYCWCIMRLQENTHTHTHLFNGPLSGTTRVSQYQKGKTNLDFTEAKDSEWQWHQLGHMQVCTSLQTDNHASTPPLSFLQTWCPSCCPTNSVKALKAIKALKTRI